MKSWEPISAKELQGLIASEIKECSEDLRNLFALYQVPLTKFSIERHESIEYVYVAAINGNEAMYYEDIEAGWNFSRYENDRLLEHWCNQDPLKFALQHWL